MNKKERKKKLERSIFFNCCVLIISVAFLVGLVKGFGILFGFGLTFPEEKYTYQILFMFIMLGMIIFSFIMMIMSALRDVINKLIEGIVMYRREFKKK